MEIILQASPRQGEVKSSGHRWQRQIQVTQFSRPPRSRSSPPRKSTQGGQWRCETLEGYFDNLAAGAVNEKDVIKQLVLNNTTLATSNESLVSSSSPTFHKTYNMKFAIPW